MYRFVRPEPSPRRPAKASAAFAVHMGPVPMGPVLAGPVLMGPVREAPAQEAPADRVPLSAGIPRSACVPLARCARRPSRVGLGLALCALLLVVLPACSGIGGSRSRQRLTFAEMQALNPGVRGEWVASRFPFARQSSRRTDGSLQRLVYSVTDPHGRVEDVTLDFDARGVLVRKHYAGAWLRPPLRVD